MFLGDKKKNHSQQTTFVNFIIHFVFQSIFITNRILHEIASLSTGS